MVCRVCKEDKEVDTNFRWLSWRVRANGEKGRNRQTLCRACEYQYTKNRRTTNEAVRRKHAAYQRKYASQNQAEHKLKKDASRRANRESHNERGRRWVANNKDKRRLIAIACAHKRRRRGWRLDLKGISRTIAECRELWRVGDKYLDAYTGELIDDPTIDHIIPIDAGGTNDPDNLCVTSLSNNSSKGTLPLLYWYLLRRQRAEELLNNFAPSAQRRETT